jgi:hypothetical protein
LTSSSVAASAQKREADWCTEGSLSTNKLCSGFREADTGARDHHYRRISPDWIIVLRFKTPERKIPSTRLGAAPNNDRQERR